MAHLHEGDFNTAVLEKQHLSTSRSGQPDDYLPHWLRPLNPYITIFSLPIRKTGKFLWLPLPKLVVERSPQLTLIPLRGKESHKGRPRKGRLRRWREQRPTPLGFVALLLLLIVCATMIRHHSYRMKLPFVPSSTNVLTDEQIARVWLWEIGRGHYPSSRRIPMAVNLNGVPNPGVAASTRAIYPPSGHSYIVAQSKSPSRFPSGFSPLGATLPTGPNRNYMNITNSQRGIHANHFPFPLRPAPDSIIDLDIVMDYCDFTTAKYVRDCLEILRTASGLGDHHHLRRGSLDYWRHVYIEDNRQIFNEVSGGHQMSTAGQDILKGLGYLQKDPHALTATGAKAYQTALAVDRLSPLQLEGNLKPPNLSQRPNRVGFGSSAHPHPTHTSADPMCDPDYPRIFHIFWAGPFTDKPYLAIMSFLFTQQLALHLNTTSTEMETFLKKICRPQLWIWINPGPAASLPNPHARSQMFDQLRENPWSAPFLHERFSQVVKFRMWNTTEQLDNIPELREYWRALPLFNSGGVKYGTPVHASESAEHNQEELLSSAAFEEGKRVIPEKQEEDFGRFGADALIEGVADVSEALAIKGDALNATAAPESSHRGYPLPSSTSKAKKKDEEMLLRVGSTSSKGYDRLTVVLSDMARFVLTHRFGGIYLDADTVLLRDWEELWGWKGAFAYRWSRLEKYNTAVLKMHRNSAIGSFIFKAALANGLDFHPMTISKYTRDASLEGLLLRLPDALFDSAWLNTEYYQRDRPAYPYFKRFEDASRFYDCAVSFTDGSCSSSTHLKRMVQPRSLLASKVSFEELSAIISITFGIFAYNLGYRR